MFFIDPRCQVFTRPKKAKKCKFTPEEDEKLKHLVSIHGENDWSFIAKQMENRNARQCRERWRNYMNPKLCNDSWTPLEDQQLLERYNQIGPHWNVIGQAFPNRSINCVRNRVIKLLRISGRSTTTLHGMTPMAFAYHQAMVPTQVLSNMFYFYGTKEEESPPPTAGQPPTPPTVLAGQPAQPPVTISRPDSVPVQTTPEEQKLQEEVRSKRADRLFQLMPTKDIADIFANPMDEFGVEDSVVQF